MPNRDTRRDFALEADGFVSVLELDSGRCTTVVGLGGARLLDLRFELYDAAGARVVADDVPGGAALVHVCPLASGRYWLAASSSRGSGAVVYETFASQPGEGQGFDGVFGGALVPAPPSEALGRQLERSAAGLLARGAEVVEGPWVETLAEGAAVRRTVGLRAGDCYVVAAQSAGAERDVDVFLFDPSGAEVARDMRPGASVVVSYCAVTGGPHTVELRAFEGSGSVASIVARVPPAESDAGVEQAPAGLDPETALQNELRRLERRGYRSAAERVRATALTTGAVATHELVLSPGCTVVLVAGGSGVGDIDLYLHRMDGTALDRDVGLDLVSRVATCVDVASTVRLEVKMFSGAGGYDLARAVAPASVRDVLAARLEIGGADYRGRGYTPNAPPRRVSLSEDERELSTVRVAAGECLAVIAAGDEGLTDVDVFLRAEDGRVLASDTGGRAWGAASACATADAEMGVEIRAYRGSGTAAIELLRWTEAATDAGVSSDAASPASDA
ncbi:MAG: hypothetical protein IT379_17650 [Deltaproteobacteria bacterium]|nr:hypothetical protein [Deltaproteobacteria bacterium]